jgi:carbon monoxide dehydrogenase subunit G
LKIDGSYPMGFPRERVWQYLTDAQIIGRCLPGCEKIEAIGPDLYEATLKIGIGSIKGTFGSHIRMQILEPGKQYKLAVEGKGAIGFLKGEGNISLDESAQSTLVLYQGDVLIGGLIASVGQRMIQAFAKQTISQFFSAMVKEMETGR